MPLIVPDLLLNGDRIAALSDDAKLHFCFLFAASNGYARLELNYHKIVAEAYKRFNNPPVEDRLVELIQEYVDAHLLFVYSVNGELWGAWDAKITQNYFTKKDKNSPEPPTKEFESWKAEYRKRKVSSTQCYGAFSKLLSHSISTTNESFKDVSVNSPEDFVESSGKPSGEFSLAVAVAVGVGVEDDEAEDDAVAAAVLVGVEKTQQQPAAPAEVFLAATGTDNGRPNPHTHGPTLVTRPRPMTDAEWGARDNAAIAHDLVNDLAASHPVPGSIDKALFAASMEATKHPDANAWATQIRKTHAQHCISWEHRRARNPNAYIPNLAVWFSDGDYRHTGVTAGGRRTASGFPRGQPDPVKCSHCADTGTILRPEILADPANPKWAALPESKRSTPCPHCQRKENRP